MRRKRSLLLSAMVGLSLALPSAIVAQTAGSAPPWLEARHRHRMADPAERLLRHQSELQLTDQQVKALEAVRAKYQERNRPLIEQVRAARPDAATRPAPGIGSGRKNS